MYIYIYIYIYFIIIIFIFRIKNSFRRPSMNDEWKQGRSSPGKLSKRKGMHYYMNAPIIGLKECWFLVGFLNVVRKSIRKKNLVMLKILFDSIRIG